MVSCSKKDHDCVTPPGNDCINSFMAINDLKQVDSDKKECIFYNIYLFEGNYYFEHVCCVCDMIAAIQDCSNEFYAILGDDKYDNFKSKAVLQNKILVKK